MIHSTSRWDISAQADALNFNRADQFRHREWNNGIKRYIKYERYYRKLRPHYHDDQTLERIFYPCRNVTEAHLNMILKAQEVWLKLGKCFEEPAREWFFTADPVCAFDRLGHPISGWKIKQCRDRII